MSLRPAVHPSSPIFFSMMKSTHNRVHSLSAPLALDTHRRYAAVWARLQVNSLLILVSPVFVPSVRLLMFYVSDANSIVCQKVSLSFFFSLSLSSNIIFSRIANKISKTSQWEIFPFAMKVRWTVEARATKSRSATCTPKNNKDTRTRVDSSIKQSGKWAQKSTTWKIFRAHSHT